MNSASLCSLAGRYENPIPPRCLAPIDFLKIPAQYLECCTRDCRQKDLRTFTSKFSIFLIVFSTHMRFDPIATKSPVRKIPPIIISVYLCKHKLHRKIGKIYVIYLCCSLVGRCSASWGNPHWREKIEIGGKK